MKTHGQAGQTRFWEMVRAPEAPAPGPPYPEKGLRRSRLEQRKGQVSCQAQRQDGQEEQGGRHGQEGADRKVAQPHRAKGSAQPSTPPKGHTGLLGCVPFWRASLIEEQRFRTAWGAGEPASDPRAEVGQATEHTGQAVPPNCLPSGSLRHQRAPEPGQAVRAAQQLPPLAIEGPARDPPVGEPAEEGAAWGAVAKRRAARAQTTDPCRLALANAFEPLTGAGEDAEVPGVTGPSACSRPRWRRAPRAGGRRLEPGVLGGGPERAGGAFARPGD